MSGRKKSDEESLSLYTHPVRIDSKLMKHIRDVQRQTYRRYGKKISLREASRILADTLDILRSSEL